MVRIASVLSLSVLLVSPWSLYAQQAPGSAPALPEVKAASGGLLRQIDEGFVAVFEKVAPGVVVIESFKEGRSDEEGESASDPFDFFRSPHAPQMPQAPHGPQGQQEPPQGVPKGPFGTPNPHRGFRLPEPENRSEGSGFILRSDGFIVTNYHVVEGAQRIRVRLHDGRKFDARLVGADEHTDIAVVKIDAKELPALALADSSTVRVGQLVCAIGIPFKLDYSFSIGCVSGLGRSGLSSLTYEDYIQTDAFINPGNSGGPLFDVDGNVLGMNTLINGLGRGLAFAIPSNMVRDVSLQLIADGRMRRPALGIRIETFAEESILGNQVKGVEKGVVVNAIEANSAAYRSDLRPLDVIVAVNGTAVATAQELQKYVLQRKVGETLQLTVWRHGAEITIPITTAELPVSGTTAAATPEPAEEEGEDEAVRDGILEESGEAALHGLELEAAGKDQKGVKVSAVAPQSLAEEAQIHVGDLIIEIDNRAVSNPDEATKALSGKKESYLLIVERNGQKTYAILKSAKE